MRFSTKCLLALVAELVAWAVYAPAATITIYPGQDVAIDRGGESCWHDFSPHVRYLLESKRNAEIRRRV